MYVFAVIWILRRFSRSPEAGICLAHSTLLEAYVTGGPMIDWAHRSGLSRDSVGCTPFLRPRVVFISGCMDA